MIDIIAGDSRTALSLENFKLHGAKGLGVYRLLFIFSYKMNPLKERKYQVRNIVLEVNLKQNNQTTHYIGRAILKEPLLVESVEHAQPGQIEFILELQSHQIEAIEKLRNGGSLIFAVKLFGEVTGGEQEIKLTNIRHHETTITVNQSTWLSALKSMGYRNVLLFEIPVPIDSTSGVSEKVLQYLRTAQKHYLAGHYDETVGYCRHVFDKLEKILSDKSSLIKIRKEYLKDLDSIKFMSKEERFLLIRHSIRHITHLAHHLEEDENEKNIPFTRNEARMILGQTASLVSFYFNELE